MGALLASRLVTNDLILALVLILAFAFILANLITDIAYTFIDPRVRYSTRRDG